MSIRYKMESIIRARVYNNLTGSSITHKDIEEWGLLESEEIEYALDLINDLR